MSFCPSCEIMSNYEWDAYFDELVIERSARTFEEAVTEAVDLMKEKVVRAKEKKFDK